MTSGVLGPTKAMALGTSRGYLTSAAELQHLKSIYDAGDASLRSRVSNMLSFGQNSPTYWPYGTIYPVLNAPSSGVCPSSTSKDSGNNDYLDYNGGARLTYEKVLAYYFTGDQAYADFARDRIMELATSTSYGGSNYSGSNQCILGLAFSLSEWITAADLLSSSPSWTATNKQTFQTWLATVAYNKVAWASRTRANNWGAFGSTASVMLADYVAGFVPTLTEVSPTPQILTSAQAYQSHIQQAKDRALGVFKGDSQCTIWGIQSYGGIPDELRRGAAGCTATSIQTADSALTYQQHHVDADVLLAEFLWHRGDTSMYNLTSSTGMGSIKKAIYFIINNPQNASGIDWDGYRKDHLYVSARYYKDPIILNKAKQYSSQGTLMSWTHITHYDQNTVPPVVAPPGVIATAAPTPTGAPVDSCNKADINRDGVVNSTDDGMLVSDLLKASPTYSRSDINLDGKVDLLDYSILAKNFSLTGVCL